MTEQDILPKPILGNTKVYSSIEDIPKLQNYSKELEAEMFRIFALAIKKTKNNHDNSCDIRNVRELVALKVQDILRDFKIPMFTTDLRDSSPEHKYWCEVFECQLRAEKTST